MLFLLLKNAKDSSLAESSCLMLALATESVIVLCFVVRYFMSILVLQSS